ncbi:hypothetical protein KCP73_13730 [Salmonella enterica subsp. enterica]|nr:hypothetical protein KCP73_13730 [Salmonella enterica subsp. enterica]
MSDVIDIANARTVEQPDSRITATGPSRRVYRFNRSQRRSVAGNRAGQSASRTITLR